MSTKSLARFDVPVPTYALSTGDLEELSYRDAQVYAAALESTGFGMLWVPEVLGREAFTTAQLVLAATKELVVASGVARALERVPKNAAAAQAALWDGFPGRYLLGLGVSGAVRDRGVGPVPFMRDYLNELDGHSERLRQQPGRLPRVIGGFSPGLTAVAAEAAEGLITVLVTPEHTRRTRELLGDIPLLTVIQWVCLEPDRHRARALARQRLAYYLTLPHQLAKFRRLGFSDDDLRPPGSDRLVDSCVLWGGADEIVRSLSVHLEAGADQIAISLLGPPSVQKLDAYTTLAAALA